MSMSAGLSVSSVSAASDEAVALLREEIQALKTDYENRIAMLEAKLAELEGVESISLQNPEPLATSLVEEEERVGQAIDQAKAYAKAFTPVTETRVYAIRQQDSVMRDRVEQVLEDFVEIGGYFRAGYGANDQGGPMVGFKAPGAAAKYRLGNEAETYGEISFKKNWYSDGAFSLDPDEREAVPGGPIAHFEMMMSYFNPVDAALQASGTDVSFPQTWASVGNVIPSQPHAKVWAGNRFYRRHDIHVNDFFFYNMSGSGGGIEDVQTALGNVAVAWIGQGSRSGVTSVPSPDPDNLAGFDKNNFDFRLYDVEVPFGEAEFGFTFATRSSGLDENGNQTPSANGWAFNFVHASTGVISEDGYNKFSLQYGRGPGLTFTSGFETFAFNGGNFVIPFTDDSWRFRFTEQLVAQVNDSFSIGPVLVYEFTSIEDVEERTWFSAGVRPILHFNEFTSVAVEAGWDWTKSELDDVSDSLFKLTVAPQVSLGGRFLSRPVLRAFVTYAKWGDDFKGQVGGIDYANKTAGLTAGMQMEAWF